MIDSMPNELFETSDALEALEALEKNTQSAILHERGNDRLDVEVKVTVQPGNASERSKVAWPGVTANVSRTGCMVVTAAPLVPGDIYWVSFDEVDAKLPNAIGRCIRSRFIQEGAFEAGLRFFQEIDISGSATE